MTEISKLEGLYKVTQSPKLKQEFEVATRKLKELDAYEILYAKQHHFE